MFRSNYGWSEFGRLASSAICDRRLHICLSPVLPQTRCAFNISWKLKYPTCVFWKSIAIPNVFSKTNDSACFSCSSRYTPHWNISWAAKLQPTTVTHPTSYQNPISHTSASHTAVMCQNTRGNGKLPANRREQAPTSDILMRSKLDLTACFP